MEGTSHDLKMGDDMTHFVHMLRQSSTTHSEDGVAADLIGVVRCRVVGGRNIQTRERKREKKRKKCYGRVEELTGENRSGVKPFEQQHCLSLLAEKVEEWLHRTVVLATKYCCTVRADRIVFSWLYVTQDSNGN